MHKNENVSTSAKENMRKHLTKLAPSVGDLNASCLLKQLDLLTFASY